MHINPLSISRATEIQAKMATMFRLDQNEHSPEELRSPNKIEPSFFMNTVLPFSNVANVFFITQFSHVDIEFLRKLETEAEPICVLLDSGVDLSELPIEDPCWVLDGRIVGDDNLEAACHSIWYECQIRVLEPRDETDENRPYCLRSISVVEAILIQYSSITFSPISKHHPNQDCF